MLKLNVVVILEIILKAFVMNNTHCNMSFIYSDVAQVSASRRIWHGFAGIHK